MSLSRRQVLRGAFGATLALPFLPSLMSKEALARTPQRPPRLLWMTTGHGGAWESNMFPTSPLTMNAAAQHAVSAGPLTSTVQGSNRVVSPILSASSTDLTDRLVGKMNVLRGLDVPFYIAHNRGLHLGNYADNDGNGGDGQAVKGSARPTIDQVLGWSPTFYRDLSSIKKRVMLLGNTNLSHNWSNPAAKSGPIQRERGESSSQNLFASIFVSSTKPTRAPIADQVLENYKSLREGDKRLSSEDRRRLDDHIANIDELQRRLGVNANCGSVTKPSDEAQRHEKLNIVDAETWANLFVDVAVAAFICGTSRIGVLGGYYQQENAFAQYAGDFHQDVAHQWETALGQQRLTAQYQAFFSKVVVKAAAKLDAISNGSGGTLLDDTLVVWSQECGVVTHDSYSIPVVTFGSAAGALRSGLSCDYRKMNAPNSVMNAEPGKKTALGLSYSQWLATVLQAMGLPRSEFELWGHQGYGVPFVGNYYAKHYVNTSSSYFTQASTPLPFIWA